MGDSEALVHFRVIRFIYETGIIVTIEYEMLKFITNTDKMICRMISRPAKQTPVKVTHLNYCHYLVAVVVVEYEVRIWPKKHLKSNAFILLVFFSCLCRNRVRSEVIVVHDKTYKETEINIVSLRKICCPELETVFFNWLDSARQNN